MNTYEEEKMQLQRIGKKLKQAHSAVMDQVHKKYDNEYTEVK